MTASAAAPRRPTDISLPEGLAAATRALDMNLSRARDARLAVAVRAERERGWRAENRKAIESWGAPLERDGLPLGRWRSF